jgi:hypothetical protein
MALDALLHRLEGVRQVGRDKWHARCPAHGDTTPSLAIREAEDGRVLIHCFAGCGAAEVLAATGLEFSDLYADKLDGHRAAPIKRPFTAADALRLLAYESLVVLQTADAMRRGEEIDRDRLFKSVARIQAALNAVEG